jgi:hypothetical protein
MSDNATPNKVGRSQDYDGNILMNWVLWVLTSIQSTALLVKTGMMAYDSDKDKVVVKTSTAVRELLFREQEIEQDLGFDVLPSDDRKLNWITTTEGLNVTINNDLPDGFYSEYYNCGPGTVSFYAGTLTTVNFPDGYVLAADKICTVFKRANGTVYLKGELTT